MHIPYETEESALLKRDCVNDCCGWEVGVLWLAVPVSPRPASRCPQGAIARFQMKVTAGEVHGDREGAAHLLFIAPTLYVVDLFQQ